MKCLLDIYHRFCLIANVGGQVTTRVWCVISIGFFIAACACDEDRGQVDPMHLSAGESVHALADAQWARAYHRQPFLDDDRFVIRWYPHSIEITSFAGLGVPKLINTLEQYKQSQTHSDPIVQTFIATAKAHGQSVKVYNTTANASIARCVKHSPKEKMSIRTDLDHAYVAYQQNGGMTAALIRVHYFAQHAVTMSHFVVTKVYLGQLARSIENQLGGTDKLEKLAVATL